MKSLDKKIIFSRIKMHIKSKKPRAGQELPRFIRKESGAAYKQKLTSLLI